MLFTKQVLFNYQYMCIHICRVHDTHTHTCRLAHTQACTHAHAQMHMHALATHTHTHTHTHTLTIYVSLKSLGKLTGENTPMNKSEVVLLRQFFTSTHCLAHTHICLIFFYFMEHRSGVPPTRSETLFHALSLPLSLYI